MPLNLATKLESLSGYRHLYPSGTPDASKNPVGFSHLRFMVGGRHVSVLSRISDYGLDYSQRTNKLAHHIIVDAPLPACGPAALLAEPGVMRDHWDGQCVNVPSPPAMPILSSEPRICRKWEAITGDAGWGGVVAQAWLSASPRPVFIIFAEHQSRELLGLMEESIALLPTNKRWQATFSTYVTTLPPDVDCRVRCVVAGSDEARMAIARGTVIDLTTELGEPPPHNLTESARSGIIVDLIEKTNIPVVADVSCEQNPETSLISSNTDLIRNNDERDVDYELMLNSSSGGSPPVLNRRTQNEIPKIKTNNKNINKSYLSIALFCVAGTLLFGFSCWLIFASSTFYRIANVKTGGNISDKSTSIQSKADNDKPEHGKLEEGEESEQAPHNNSPPLEESKKPMALETVAPPHGNLPEEKPAPTQVSDDFDSLKMNSEESKAIKLFEENIKITFDGFYLELPGESSEEKKLQLRQGVPRSKIKAILAYESDNEVETAQFSSLINEAGNVKWTWRYSNDNAVSWMPFSGREECILTLEETDVPNVILGVDVTINGTKDLFALPEIQIKRDLSYKVADRVKIHFQQKEFLSALKKDDLDKLQIRADFPPILDKNFEISFIDNKNKANPRPRKLSTVSLIDLRNRSASENRKVYFDSFEKAKRSLEKVNDARGDLRKALSASSDSFQQKCRSNGFLEGNWNQFPIGLRHLREPDASLIQDLSITTSWDSKSFVDWFASEKKRKRIAGPEYNKGLPASFYNNLSYDLFAEFFVNKKKNDRDLSDDVEVLTKEFDEFIKARSIILSSSTRLPLPVSGIGVFSDKKHLDCILELALWTEVQIDMVDSSVAHPTSHPGAGAPVELSPTTQVVP
jgi:hypothetical protein